MMIVTDIKKNQPTAASKSTAATHSARATSSAHGVAFSNYVQSSKSRNDRLGTTARLLGGTSELTNVETLLAIQAMGSTDPDEQSDQNQAQPQNTPEQEAKEQGFNLLQQLEMLQLEMLQGNINVTTLQDIQGKMRIHKTNIQDPVLLRLIKDIELRAAVEMAKFQRAKLIE